MYIIAINKKKVALKLLSFSCVLYSLLLHPKLISFNSNWLVIWPPFSWVHLFYSQGVLTWNETLVMIVRLVLGSFRYQVYKLPAIFTFMKSSSTTELFYIGLQVLVVSWTYLFLQQRCFWGG